MQKKLGLIALILAVVALGLSVYNTLTAYKPAPQPAEDIQYVLYLGTNDKDTNVPKYTPDEAKQLLDTVLTKHFEGFTIQEANGGWTNENGTVDHEYTLVIYLSDTTLDKVHTAAKDLISAFNQSAVLIQSNKTTTEFYSGD